MTCGDTCRLKRRYAQGELSEEEFEKKKRHLMR